MSLQSVVKLVALQPMTNTFNQLCSPVKIDLLSMNFSNPVL